MTYILQVFLLLTCLLQASPLVASSNFVIPAHTPIFSTQATQKLESEEKIVVFHFARSGIEENILQQTTPHFSPSKQSPTFLKDAVQNFGVLQLEKSLAKSWGVSQYFSTKEKLSLVENRAREVFEVFVSGAGNVVVSSWSEAVSAVDNLILPKTSQLNNLFPNAKIGYRGSLSTGTKFSTGGPFDPMDWDVDAFIVSDNLAAQIGGGGFRNGRNIPSIANIADDLEASFKNISGYRTELNKPFTFRVFTEAEFNSIVKPNGYKLFE